MSLTWPSTLPPPAPRPGQSSSTPATSKSAKESKESIDKLYSQCALLLPPSPPQAGPQKLTQIDALATHTLKIQADPIHSLRELEILVEWAGGKGKREAAMAREAVLDLMVARLLPQDRKLKTFAQQPIHNTILKDSHKILFYFEDRLKTLYFKFIQTLQEAMKDSLLQVKYKALGMTRQLLCERPEQEALLLEILVNKMGDNVKQIASKAVYELNEVVKIHPVMKPVIVKEVMAFVWRDPKSQYYPLIFLNQMILTHKDEETAQALVHFYISVFQKLVKDDTADSKRVSAALTGINRALPFSNLGAGHFEEHLPVMFQRIHTAPLPIALQALSLMHTLTADKPVRFMRALYTLLQDARLLNLSPAKQGILFNLLRKIIPKNYPGTRAIIKRMLQTGLIMPIEFLLDALLTTPHPLPVGTDSKKYDPKKRDPEFAGAEAASIWEARILSYHFHPAVPHFLINTEYSGDITTDFGVSRMLDKFVYKPPKTKSTIKGSSLMQKAKTEGLGIGDVFFEEYFKRAGPRDKKPKANADEEEDLFETLLGGQEIDTEFQGDDMDDSELDGSDNMSDDEDEEGEDNGSDIHEDIEESEDEEDIEAIAGHGSEDLDSEEDIPGELDSEDEEMSEEGTLDEDIVSHVGSDSEETTSTKMKAGKEVDPIKIQLANKKLIKSQMSHNAFMDADEYEEMLAEMDVDALHEADTGDGPEDDDEDEDEDVGLGVLFSGDDEKEDESGKATVIKKSKKGSKREPGSLLRVPQPMKKRKIK